MQNALLVGLSRQVALGRELDVVANNIANINTTGYKADGSLFEEYLSSAARADQTGARVSFVRDRGTWHDLSPGPIEKTGNPLDVAIDGNAFLVVQTPRGERYTRNGALQINANRPARHQRRQSGARRRRPDLVPAERPSGLDQPRRHHQRARRHLENAIRSAASCGWSRSITRSNCRRTAAAHSRPPAARSRSRPRHRASCKASIEKSNVRGVVEMSRMIEITRSYTQVAAMLQQQNDLSQSAIDKLAEVPN